MLYLKRVIMPYEALKCQISNEIITYGDYYYEDDEDGFIVKASVYGEELKKKKEEEFDYSKLEQAQSEKEYSDMLKEAEREFLNQTLFDRKVAGKEGY